MESKLERQKHPPSIKKYLDTNGNRISHRCCHAVTYSNLEKYSGDDILRLMIGDCRKCTERNYLGYKDRHEFFKRID